MRTPGPTLLQPGPAPRSIHQPVPQDSALAHPRFPHPVDPPPTLTPAITTGTQHSVLSTEPQLRSPSPTPARQEFCLVGNPTKHSSWPPEWRSFLDVARAFVLCDLIFGHGFPTPFGLRNAAGEALTLAWYILQNERLQELQEKSGCYAFKVDPPKEPLKKCIRTLFLFFNTTSIARSISL